MADVVTVVCVLRSGGVYKPQHVRRLRDQVSKHLRQLHRFVCLADYDYAPADDDIECAVLPRDYPGWWSKICLFYPGLFDGPTLYFDLDTTIIGPIDDLADQVHDKRLIMLHGMTNPRFPGSGVMGWGAQVPNVFADFDRDPGLAMSRCVTSSNWGDQGFIAHHVEALSFWQDLLPGQICSFKVHCLRIVQGPRIGAVPPSGARVVCYHGIPKPWDASAGLLLTCAY